MKKIFISFLLVLTMVSLVACSGGEKITDEDNKKYGEKSEEIINLINKRDRNTILTLSSEELKAVLTEDTFNKTMEIIKSKGEFKSFGDYTGIYKEDKSTKEKYTVIAYKVEYTNGTIIYKLSFDKDGKLSGLYL